MRLNRLLTFLLPVAVLAVPPLHADEAAKRELLQPPVEPIASPITDRFEMGGTYWAGSIGTQIRYDGSGGVPGTTVSAEHLLGLDDRLREAGFDLMFRLTERNRLRVDYLGLTRHGDVVLNQPVQFGDNLYAINDRVQTSFDLRLLGLDYTHSFLKTERFEFGAGLAVHLVQTNEQGEVTARRLTQSFDKVGALPTLAADGTWRISTRFAATARGEYVAVHTSGIDGSFGIYHFDLQYRALPNLTAGLGYTNLHALVNSDSGSFSGRIDLKLKGPEFFVRASF